MASSCLTINPGFGNVAWRLSLMVFINPEIWLGGRW